jgi:hypothetical protein
MTFTLSTPLNLSAYVLDLPAYICICILATYTHRIWQSSTPLGIQRLVVQRLVVCHDFFWDKYFFLLICALHSYCACVRVCVCVCVCVCILSASVSVLCGVRCPHFFLFHPLFFFGYSRKSHHREVLLA